MRWYKSIAAVFLLLLTLLVPQTALAETKTVRVGYYQEDANSFMLGAKEGAKKSGYAYDYLQQISSYIGWRYEYVYGGFSELYEKLLNGDIDVMPGVVKTPARTREVLFPSQPMGWDGYHICARSGDYRFADKDIFSINGTRIGILRGAAETVLLENFIRQNGLSCEIVFCESDNDLSESVAMGVIDLIISCEVGDDAGLVAIAELGKMEHYLAVSKSRPELLKDLAGAQEIIRRLQPEYVTQLYYKYYSNDRYTLKFSEAEMDWLRNHRTLKVGTLHGSQPTSYLDDNGKPAGFIVDCFEFMAKKLKIEGIKYDYTFFYTYDEMIGALKSGKVDVVFPILTDAYVAERDGYIITQPILESSMSVCFRDDSKELEKVMGKVAVPKGLLAEVYLGSNYPQVKQRPFEGRAECLRAVKSGEVEGAVFASMFLNRFINQSQEFAGLKSVPLSKRMEISLGVKPDDTNLFLLLNRGISKLPDQLYLGSVLKHQMAGLDYTAKDFFHDHKEAFAIAVLAVLVVIGLLLRRMREKEKVAEREQELNRQLQDQQAELEMQTQEIAEALNAVTSGTDKEAEVKKMLLKLKKYQR